jgi:biotin carboxyl carrier protein
LQYEIEAGGRVRHVTVTRTGDGFAVAVDGRLHQVDAARIDVHTLSLIVDNVWQRDTVIVREDGGRLVVFAGAVPVTIGLNGGRTAGGRQSVAGTAGSGPLRIVAPMPGKVVRILVKVGDAVQARQPVVVVEAMKMENQLHADRDGTVAEIHTREGMSVEAGALLVVIR